MFDDTGIARMVGDLQVKCTNNEHGCEWIGDFRELQVFIIMPEMKILVIFNMT